MIRMGSMISKLHLFGAALAGVLICSLAAAQTHGGVASMPAPSGHARPAARVPANPMTPAAARFQPTQPARVIQNSPHGMVSPVFAANANWFSSVTFSGVPGLGFDYPHLAAISAGLNNNFPPRFGRGGHRGSDSFVPILFGGYPYYYDDLSYDQPDPSTAQPSQPQPQPQIIVIEQPVPAQPAVDSGNYVESPPAPAAEQAASPIREVGDFILVRRDGRILFASVFSVVGAQVRYVTPEGIRHTLAVADLDSDATEQMNEARGTTVQIRN